MEEMKQCSICDNPSFCKGFCRKHYDSLLHNKQYYQKNKEMIKEKVKNYRIQPKVKQRLKQYFKEYEQRPSAKQHKRQYRRLPNVAEHKNEYNKEYVRRNCTSKTISLGGYERCIKCGEMGRLVRMYLYNNATKYERMGSVCCVHSGITHYFMSYKKWIEIEE